MRVFVSGGTGFVGEEVVETLIRNKIAVTLLVRQAAMAKQNVQRWSQSPEVTIVVGDVRSLQDVTKALKGADAVVHLVGTRRKEMKRLGLSYFDVDTGSVRTLVDALRIEGDRPVILLSAVSMGESEYVRAKREAEEVLKRSVTHYTILKPAMIVGPGQEWARLFGPPLRMLGSLPGALGAAAKRAGNVERKDVANAVMRALSEPRAQREWGVEEIRTDRKNG